jgi:CubicO group peptidase (beta-lactamase class C family)
MEHSDLEFRLQIELNTLVTRNEDIFSAVLGVSDATGAFRWAGAAGTAHPDSDRPMTVDTPIFIASVTKMFTAAATMILQERGALSLDDPISEYLPPPMVEGLHSIKGRDYSDQLTVYHLVSQTSGLPDYFEETPKGGKSVYDQIVASGDMEWDLDDVVRIVKGGLSAKFPPEPLGERTSGKRAYYSDTNYQLLGAILETVAQKPLHEVYSDLIIQPLGLPSTYLHGYGDPVASSDNPPANVYHRTEPLFLDRAMTSFGPDGGIVSTVDDSLAFIKHFMEGTLFEEPSTLPRMKRWKRIFSPFQYGLGLMRFKLPRISSPFSATPELIGHSGASSAFLFHSDIGQLYIGGTLNQLENQRRPFSLMLTVIKTVGETLS